MTEHKREHVILSQQKATDPQLKKAARLYLTLLTQNKKEEDEV